MQRSVVHNIDQLWEEVNQMKDVFSLDTETTDLRLAKLEIEGFSCCDGSRAFYVPLNKDESYRDEALSILKHVLDNSRGVIMHNAKFDLEVLKLSKVPYEGRVFCTLVAAHLLDENRPNGLKDLAISELNMREVVTYQEASLEGTDTTKFYTYATNDAVWTYQLYKKFGKQLKDAELWNLFHKVEMPFQHVLTDMELHGVVIDQQRLEVLEKEVQRSMNQIIMEMCNHGEIEFTAQKLLNGELEVKPAINFNSTPQVVKVIEEKLKIELTEKTKKGNKSLSREALIQIKDRHPFINLLIQYRIGQKCLSSFISPLPNLIDADGRLRTNFNDCGAKTGRLSSKNPNVQQLPRTREEFPIEFRKVYTAPEGKSLIALDYSGQELCVLAHVSQDPVLIDALRSNMDLHLVTANKLFNLGLQRDVMVKTHPDHEAVKSKYKHERHVGKNGINFPIIYGTTSYGISRNLGISEKKAQSYIDAFFELYPEVKRTIKKCTNQLWKRGYVRTQVGRFRHLDARFDKSHRQAFNFLIQGLSADMIRMSMIRIREHLLKHPEYGACQVMTIHDEIVIEAKDEYSQQVYDECALIMENVMNLSVPLKVEGSIGRNYGEVK